MAIIHSAHMDSYKQAVNLLRAGELVALPTDTVYGLAGVASNAQAREKIYAVKKRPSEKQLSVVVFSPEQASKVAHVSNLARDYMAAFWPGALTLVMPAKIGDGTIAVRCPDVTWTAAFGTLGFHDPLVLPSANISGAPAPTTAHEVEQGIGGQIPLIIDGGVCKAGVASSIISVVGGRSRLLRIGALAPEQLASFDIELDLA